MGQVFDYELSASERLVMLALADHADHNGENAFPSVDLLAWKTSMTERGVRGILQRLHKRGALVEQRRPGYHRPRTYRIVLAALPAKAPRLPREKEEPASSMKEERGREKEERIRSTEPSPEPSDESSSRARVPDALELAERAYEDNPCRATLMELRAVRRRTLRRAS